MKILAQAILDKVDLTGAKWNKNTVTFNNQRGKHSDFFRDISKELPTDHRISLLELQDYTALINELRKLTYVCVETGSAIMSEKYPPLIPVVDYDSGVKYLVTEENVISSADFLTWLNLLDPEQAKLVRSATVLGKKRYMPNASKTKSITIDGAKVLQINSYTAPFWMAGFDTANLGEEMPEDISALLTHLFGSGENLEYVLDWMYYAITDRMSVALVLNGSKGVGKGVFGTLLKCLIGSQHSRKARVNILDTNFNSDFQNNRFLEFDELKINKLRVNHLKLYFNDVISVEVKGIDGKNQITNHNSFLISANGAADLYLESDDRRFSVVELTNNPLFDIWDENKIADFISEIEVSDDSIEYSEVVAQFGHWLLKRGAKLNYGKSTPYKTKRFHELVDNSLTGWQYAILEAVNKAKEANETTLGLYNLRKRYNRKNSSYPMPKSDTQVSDFLKNYREDGIVLGVLEEGIINFDAVSTANGIDFLL